MSSKIKSIISLILALVLATIFVVITMQLIVVFDADMLPKLIIPIIIVAFPFYALLRKGLFKK